VTCFLTCYSCLHRILSLGHSPFTFTFRTFLGILSLFILKPCLYHLTLFLLLCFWERFNLRFFLILSFLILSLLISHYTFKYLISVAVIVLYSLVKVHVLALFVNICM
jgi:hypothetical protein